jgi:hypothetical protein
MNGLLNRFLAHWKTTCGGLLSVAGIIVSAVQVNSPDQKWTLTATAIVAGLTGLLAKDE